MGYLQNSNTMIKNSMNELDKILHSGSSISITGLGEPILVTWYNINDKLSTVTNGLETADEILGPSSPFRFNRVKDVPVFGITKDIQNLEMHLDDQGVMDMDWEIEPVIPPRTIVPSPYDHMRVDFANGRNATFRVNNVQISTMYVNGFYKAPMHLVDIDSDDFLDKLEANTVKKKTVVVENVGTNDQCLVSDDIFEDIKNIERIVNQSMSDYVDTFFNRKYNSFIFRGYCNEKYIIYDPYLTKFILNHDLLDHYSEILQPVVIEQGNEFRKDYNKTVFRAVEMRDMRRVKELLYDVVEFSRKKTNPFMYWGEEAVYQIQAYEFKDRHVGAPRNTYMDFNWLYNLKSVEESNVVTMLENIIIRYFKRSSFENFIKTEELSALEEIIYEPEYSETFFYLVPIVLFILITYKEHLLNADL